MNEVPCRVSAELNRYLRDQEERMLQDRLIAEQRRYDASQDIRDAEKLRKMLNDQSLAASLAAACAALEGAKYELEQLEKYGIQPQNLVALKTLVSMNALTETVLYRMALGEE